LPPATFSGGAGRIGLADEREDAPEDEDRQDQVGQRPGQDDERTRPDTLLGERARGVGGLGRFVAGVFPDHLDIAAERKGGQQVLRLASLHAHELRAETQGKLQNPDLRPLGHQEVAQLVEEDQRPEDNHRCNYRLNRRLNSSSSHEAAEPRQAET
jgi:hypothetical protein